MISGSNPFRTPGDGIFSVLSRQMEAPPSLSSRCPNRAIPAGLDQLLLRTLSQQPSQRPARCSDFYSEFIGLLEGGAQDAQISTQQPAVSVADVELAPPIQPALKQPVWLLGLVGFLVCGLVLLWAMPEELAPKPPIKSTPVAASMAAPATAPKPSSEPAPITIIIESEPDGADIYVDGQRIGQTPYTNEWPQSEQTIAVQLTKKNYDPFSYELRLDNSQRHNARLVRSKPKITQPQTPKPDKDGTANPFIKTNPPNTKITPPNTKTNPPKR
jgi:hypothetical protein